MAYAILYKDNVLVGINPDVDVATSLDIPAISIKIVEGPVPDLNKTIWDPDELCLVSVSRELTKLEFLTRFTTEERIAIYESQDPIIKDALSLLNAASYVSLDNPMVVQLVNYLALTGIIDAKRVDSILS